MKNSNITKNALQKWYITKFAYEWNVLEKIVIMGFVKKHTIKTCKKLAKWCK